MGKYYVNFSCGHSEEKELFGKMDRRYRRIEYWESYGICSKCYYEKKEIEKSLNCEEVEMFYGDYVTNYKKYNTKAGSYNGSTKTIIVYVPKNE